MAKTFSFEEAMQPAAKQPQTFSFEEATQPAAEQAKTFSFEEATKPSLPTAPTQAVSTVVNPLNPIAEPEEKGFFARNIDWAADNLRSGWENIISSYEGDRQNIASEFIARLEEKYGPGAVNAPPDKQQLYKEAVAISEKAISERQRIAAQQQQRYEQNPQREATREFKAAISGFDEDKLSFIESAAKAGDALLSNPVGVIADLGLESTPASIKMLASAILTRFAGGSNLMAAGAGGYTSAITEFGNEYAARRDKGMSHDKAWLDAAQKSGVIGLLDAVSMNSAGKAAGVVMDALSGTKRLKTAAKEVAKETGKQAALGAAGEAGGSLAIGEVPNPAGVLAEAVGEVFGAPLEAVGTYRALKPTPESREAAAIRGLDALAEEEEKQEAATTAKQRVEPTLEEPPTTRNLDSLTRQEVDSIQRRLYAELGRPPTKEELLGAFNDYLAERETGIGVESGAGVAGVPSTGAEQPAGGIDTGAAATPATGGLDVSGVPTDQLETGARAQPSTLEEAQAEYTRTYDAAVAAYNALNTANKEYTEALKNGTEEEQQQTLEAAKRLLSEHKKLYADYEAALENLRAMEAEQEQTFEEPLVDLDVKNETEGIPSQEDVEAAKPKSEEVLDEAEVKGGTDIAALEQEERARFDEVKRIEEEQKALLTKAGRIPAKNSPSRAKYDALERQRTEAHWNWVGADKKLYEAKITQQTGVDVSQTVNTAAQELFDANPDYDVNEYDAAETKLIQSLRERGVSGEALKGVQDAFSNRLVELDNQRQQGGDVLPNLARRLSHIDTSLADMVPQNQNGINRINQLWNEGRITYFEYTREMNKLTERLADQRAMRRATRSNLPRERGFGRVVKALEDAARQGRIPPQMADMAIWFLTQNRALAADLAISIAEPTNTTGAIARTSDAIYQRMQRLINIFLVRDRTGAYREMDELSAVHEILHHMERMLPNDLRGLIRNEWRVRLETSTREAEQKRDKANAEITKNTKNLNSPDVRKRAEAERNVAQARNELTRQTNILEYLRLVAEANATQEPRLFDQAIEMIIRGEVPRALYALMNASEFWAVTGSNIIAGRYGAAYQNRFRRIAQYLREFIEKIKEVFGLPSDDPIIRGLNAMLRGDGTFVSREMLRDGEELLFPNINPNKGWTKAETEISAEEKKLQEQFASTGSLHPSVVEAIKNNDLNGALKILSEGMTGFYGELATKLLALDLKTSISFDNTEQVAQQVINRLVGPQLSRVMSFLEVAHPKIYAQYFHDYRNPENIDRVASGLNTLMFSVLAGKYATVITGLGPIANEIRDADTVYSQMRGAKYMPGAYFNTLDAITLNSNKIRGIGNRVLLHEVVHAATVSLLKADPSQLTTRQWASREELEKLFNLAKDNIKIKHYGFTNLQEFVAELFTNEEFYKELKKIPYPAANNYAAESGMLSRFINAIFKLVGFNNLASRAMTEAEKLFTATRYQETKLSGASFAQAKKKRYRKGPLTSSWKSAEDVINSKVPWIKAAPHITNLIWNIATGPIRIKMLGALELRHLSDLTKNKFPQISAAVRMIEKMTAHRGKIMTDAAKITKDWAAAQRKNAAQSQLLGRVMLEATISGVEVDPSNTVHYDATRIKPQVKAAWDALDPEFQSIYRRVRDFYKKQVTEMIRTLKEQANTIQDPVRRQKVIDAINRDFGPDKLVFPYFPLKRFGQHWFQVDRDETFKEFYEFESYSQRELAFMKRKIQLLSGNAKQRGLAASMEKGNAISELHKKFADAGEALKAVNDLVDALSDQVTDQQTGATRDKTINEAKEELRDNLNQLIYTLLPQQSVRKMMLNRKSVQGASSDMLRVFASSATRLAYQQARSKYSPAFLANLNNARAYISDMGNTRTADEKEVFRDFVYEVEKRHKPMLGIEETSDSAKIAGLASDFITFMMMSAPMSAALNTIGFAQLAATKLGGRYGYIKATDHLWNNFMKYTGSTVKRTLVPMAKGQFISIEFPSAMESGKLEGIDKLAAQQLIDEEQVNISQTYDMVGVGDRPSELSLSKYEAIKRAVFAPLHQLERFNREMTLLSSFQLEYEKLMSEPKREANGVIIRDAQGNPEMYQNDATTPDGVPYSTEAFDRALGEAKDLTGITLGETTRQMRPRFFMHPVASLLLKFRRYAITAIYSVIRNFSQGFIAPFSKTEVDQMRRALEADKQPPDVIEQKIKEMEEFRKELASEGRKTLAGTLGVTSLFTGAVGLPLSSLVLPILIKMLSSDDDDDEFFDWDNWFRNYMEKEFGGYLEGMLEQMGASKEAAAKVGRAIGESIAVGPITTLTGGSFTERASLDFKSLLFRDLRYSPNARQTVAEGLIQAMGPIGGLALTLGEGAELIQKGEYARAAEKLLPAIVAKPLIASRYATEGAKTTRGDTLVDDVTATEVAMQAIGLTPHRVAEKQRQSIQAIQKQQKIFDRRDTIMDELWMAFTTGDEKAINDATEKALKFSTRYPTLKITGKQVADSFKKRKTDQVMAEAIGARIDKRMIPELSPMLQYGND